MAMLEESMQSCVEMNDSKRSYSGRRRPLPTEKTHFTSIYSVRAIVFVALVTVAILLAGGPTASGFYLDEQQSPKLHEWNYHDQIAWRKMYRDCAGRAQSPIDIQHKNVIISPHLKLYFYNYNRALKFKLSNAHHTIKLNPVGTPVYDSPNRGEGSVTASFDAPSSVETGLQSNDSAFDLLEGFVSDHIEASSHEQNESPPSASSASGNHSYGGRQQQQQNQQQRKRQPTFKRPEARDKSSDIDKSSSASIRRSRAGAIVRAYAGVPTIKLDWLDDGNNEYKLHDIHFHWGERRDNGSEHAIDGRRAAMEMHLVHIKHGLDKSKIGFVSDSVAVISILIESHRKSNADFNPIVNMLARINGSSELVPVVEYESINDLLPSNLNAFYTYSGSLTTPPCYQVVQWIVMADRLNMNAKQIEMFRNLHAPPAHEPYEGKHEEEDEGAFDQQEGRPSEPGEAKVRRLVGEPIMPNMRAVQVLNNRTIMASFIKHGGRLETPISGARARLPVISFSQEHLHLRWDHLWLALILLTSVRFGSNTSGQVNTFHFNYEKQASHNLAFQLSASILKCGPSRGLTGIIL